MLHVTTRGKVARTSATGVDFKKGLPDEMMEALIADAHHDSVSILSGKQRNTVSLARVLRYKNNALIVRIAKEARCSKEEASQLFQDTLRFLWLCSRVRGVIPTKRLDIGWHAFILFTMDYQKFCHKYFGYFIHHRPNRPEDKFDGGAALKMTVAVIQEHLGDNLSKNWVYAPKGSRKCEFECGGCCGAT